MPYGDAEPVLRSLCEQGVKVGIISDFAWDLRVHLEHWGLDAWVDDVVISYLEGCEKPDPVMFLKACRNLDVDPRAALMVGTTRPGTAARRRSACGPTEPRNDERGLEHVLGFLA